MEFVTRNDHRRFFGSNENLKIGTSKRIEFEVNEKGNCGFNSSGIFKNFLAI